MGMSLIQAVNFMKGFFMSKKVKNNVVWVDFKSKRTYDLSRLGHPVVSKQPVPYLCQPKRAASNLKGGAS